MLAESSPVINCKNIKKYNFGKSDSDYSLMLTFICWI